MTKHQQACLKVENLRQCTNGAELSIYTQPISQAGVQFYNIILTSTFFQSRYLKSPKLVLEKEAVTNCSFII